MATVTTNLVLTRNRPRRWWGLYTRSSCPEPLSIPGTYSCCSSPSRDSQSLCHAAPRLSGTSRQRAKSTVLAHLPEMPHAQQSRAKPASALGKFVKHCPKPGGCEGHDLIYTAKPARESFSLGNLTFSLLHNREGSKEEHPVDARAELLHHQLRYLPSRLGAHLSWTPCTLQNTGMSTVVAAPRV